MKKYNKQFSYSHFIFLLLVLVLSNWSCNNIPRPVVPSNPAIGPKTTTLNSSTVSVCNTNQIADFDYINDELLGVFGSSPYDFIDKDVAAKKFVLLDNWNSYDGYKQCMCGKFYKYKDYIPTALNNLGIFGQEEDWNIFVNPEGESRDLFELAEVYPEIKTTSNGFKDWNKDDFNGQYILEGEVTPHPDYQSILLKKPFDEDTDNQPVTDNQKVCLYGPWVREKLHNNRPEVHPMELIWFKRNGNWHILISQDASNRFGKKGQYKGPKRAGWKPWSEPPMTGIFEFPFEIDLTTTQTITYNLSKNGSIHEIDKHPYADNHAANTLEIDNVKRVFVNKPVGVETTIGVKYVDFCKTSTNTLKGYVQISLQVGKNANKDEGVYSLKVEKKSSVPPVLARQQLNPTLPQEKENKLKSDSNLVATTRQIVNQNPKQDGPYLLIPWENKRVDKSSPASDLTSAAYLEINQISARGIPVIAYETIDFDIRPYYCPNRDGECEPTFGTAYEAAIFLWLQQQNIELKNTKIAWTFRGIPYNSDRHLFIDTTENSNADIWIRQRNTEWKNGGISIHFPHYLRRLFKLEATATISDDKGNSGQKIFIFNSHSLDNKDALANIEGAALLKEISEKLGYSFEDNFAQRYADRQAGKPYNHKQTGSKVRRNLNEIKHQMVLNYYDQIGIDGTVTNEEIEVLTRLIQQAARER